MIAPLMPIEPEVSERQRRLRKMYRVIAAKFLPVVEIPVDDPPPVARWRAWIFAAWVVVVTAVYVVKMVK